MLLLLLFAAAEHTHAMRVLWMGEDRPDARAQQGKPKAGTDSTDRLLQEASLLAYSPVILYACSLRQRCCVHADGRDS